MREFILPIDSRVSKTLNCFLLLRNNLYTPCITPLLFLYFVNTLKRLNIYPVNRHDTGDCGTFFSPYL